MRLPPGLCPRPRRGLPASAPSWQTLGLTIAEGPTELRAPGPRDPTIRHCLYQCWSSLDLKLFTDGDDITLSGNEFQFLITLLLKQCCRIVLLPYYIFVSLVSYCDPLFVLMGLVSATRYLHHTHCVGICKFRSYRLSRVYTLVMEVHTRDCACLRRNSTVANKPVHGWTAYTVTTLSRPGDSLKPPDRLDIILFASAQPSRSYSSKCISPDATTK